MDGLKEAKFIILIKTKKNINKVESRFRFCFISSHFLIT